MQASTRTARSAALGASPPAAGRTPRLGPAGTLTPPGPPLRTTPRANTPPARAPPTATTARTPRRGDPRPGEAADQRAQGGHGRELVHGAGAPAGTGRRAGTLRADQPHGGAGEHRDGHRDGHGGDPPARAGHRALLRSANG